ncbi:hypothetical protein L6164_018590 [Bauhinia variegata]|uniref:Uncharacterized protein n=1 Tax=Bauhinia variegata TaxID=167791 RepID=A0ACB9NDQ0_BAUVA|nr:hypothetical protein L6164_018590 [Bauhinia variegata]
MARRLKSHAYLEEPEPDLTPETMPESPSSGDDAKTEAPSPKKRKGMQKRVVTVPISDVEGSKSKGETPPPADSWAWRKYGQKPIKGSPYPRGYYRCSSSKGCPARKQVERCREDPTKLTVNYANEHNHSMPIGKSHSSSAATDATAAATPTTSSDGAATSTTESADRLPPEELTVFASDSDVELAGDSVVLLSDRFGWFIDVVSTSVLESPICGEVEYVASTIGEEDESLFADLGELPECSTVFRRRNILSSSAIQCRGITFTG